ncbi:hypothetical protein RchiOBHm_Chr1g0355721 [Rosa chinensis]|uniref:Uncharacterized protein n=1 Tax=Rosa chinensis TaxID=74649 RepID=A0A2P6SHG3_ROSCH|nr:hypothetical protein RchiOBHm_Chr1g0355721 [Rosa chinensis]
MEKYLLQSDLLGMDSPRSEYGSSYSSLAWKVVGGSLQMGQQATTSLDYGAQERWSSLPSSFLKLVVMGFLLWVVSSFTISFWVE